MPVQWGLLLPAIKENFGDFFLHRSSAFKALCQHFQLKIVWLFFQKPSFESNDFYTVVYHNLNLSFSFSYTLVYAWSPPTGSPHSKEHAWSSRWVPQWLFNPIQPGSSLEAWYRPHFNHFQASRAWTSTFRSLLLVGAIYLDCPYWLGRLYMIFLWQAWGFLSCCVCLGDF